LPVLCVPFEDVFPDAEKSRGFSGRGGAWSKASPPNGEAENESPPNGSPSAVAVHPTDETPHGSDLFCCERDTGVRAQVKQQNYEQQSPGLEANNNRASVLK